MGGLVPGRSAVVAALGAVLEQRGVALLARHGDGLTTTLNGLAQHWRLDRGDVRFIRMPTAEVPPGGEPERLIVIDDAHRATTPQIEQILRLADTARLLIGARLGASPEPLAWLWRSGFLEQVELEQMSFPDVVAVIEARTGARVHSGVAAKIAHRCGHRPGFVVDELDALLAAGQLAVGPDAIRAGPGGLEDRASDLLADLPDRLRQAVRILAVTGSVSEQALVRLDVDERELRRRRLATVEQREHGRYIRLDPPILAAAVRSAMSGRELRAIASDLPAVVRDGLDGPDAVRVAVTLEESADVHALIAAVDEATRANDMASAQRLAAEAARRSPEGAIAEAHVFSALGRHQHAAQAFERVAAREDAHPLTRVIAAIEASLAMLWHLDDGTAAQSASERLAATTVGTPLHDAALTHHAAVTMYTGNPAAAGAIAAAVVGRLPEHTVVADTAHLVDIVCRALVDPGAIGGAAAVSPLTDDPESGHPDRLEAWIRATAAALALELAGYHRTADAVIAGAQSAAASEVTPTGLGWFALARARAELAAGRVTHARRFADEAWDSFTGVGHVSGRRWASGARLLADAMLGDRLACAEGLETLDGLSSAASFLDPDLLRAAAWARWVIGESDRARQLFDAAVDTARITGSLALEAVALHDCFRAFRADVLRRLVTIDRRSPAPAVTLRRRHVELVAAEDPAGLVELALEFEQTGAFMLAAEVATDAHVLATSVGRRSTAGVALREHARLTALLDAAGPLARIERGPRDLTAREREVAILAADGLSSREVAARLGISVRTVDNLLYRVYAKLGIRGRDELVAYLTR